MVPIADPVAQSVEELRNAPARSRVSTPDGITAIPDCPDTLLPFQPHTTLGSTQTPTELSNRWLPWGQRRPECKTLRAVQACTETKTFVADYGRVNLKALATVMLAIFVIFLAKNDYIVMSVRPVGTTRLPLDGFSWKLDIWAFFRNPMNKTQLELKSDKKDGHFTWRPIYSSGHISLISSQNEEYLRHKF